MANRSHLRSSATDPVPSDTVNSTSTLAFGVHVCNAMRLVAAVHDEKPVLAVVNAREWRPTEAAFDRALNNIRDRDYVDRVRRFRKGHASSRECRHHEMDDPRCFVIGQALLATAFGAKAAALASSPDRDVLGDVVARRTAEGRPHVGHLGTWFNSNISHAGGVVALAAVDLPGYVVGCDLMPVELTPPRAISVLAVDSLFDLLHKYFTAAEWTWIRAPIDSDAVVPPRASDCTSIAAFFQLKRFLTLWTLKEALIKAMGIGLGFDLRRSSFSLSRTDVWAADFYTTATAVSLQLDGALAPECTFTLWESSEWNTVVATSLVPVSLAGESSFARTFDPVVARYGAGPYPAVDVRGTVRSHMSDPMVLDPEEVIAAVDRAVNDVSAPCTSETSNPAHHSESQTGFEEDVRRCVTPAKS